MSDDIRGFFGPNRWLSNFWVEPFILEGETCRSAEHAFQAAKAVWEKDVRLILDAPTPAEAKRLGRRIEIWGNWDEVKVARMRTILAAKFSNAGLRRMLIATGNAELVEVNTWGDTFWGVCHGRGENHLGRLLMELRQELQELSIEDAA